VVEFFGRLQTTQFANHVRPHHAYAPDLRKWELMERIGTPFDKTARTVDVRRIDRGAGGYNIHNVGVFLWRLRPFSATWWPASAVDSRRYRFDALGRDMPLFTLPQPKSDPELRTTSLNVPMPISRRVLFERLADYYGDKLSIYLRFDGVEVPIDQVTACDLSDTSSGVCAVHSTGSPKRPGYIPPWICRRDWGRRISSRQHLRKSFDHADGWQSRQATGCNYVGVSRCARRRAERR
jgi:hypothetical protein